MTVRRLLQSRAIQPKLEVGSPSDPLETEADHAADEVIHGAPAPCACGGHCAKCRAPPSGLIQRREDGSKSSAAPARVDDDFIAGLGRGHPLDPEARALLEAQFGRDLGHVRVHTGPQADQAASLIHARAFTIGADIAFRADLYAPHTASGRRLLAHEVAHVVQQERGSPSTIIRRVGLGDPPFGHFPAERAILDRERAQRRAEELRHQAWVKSHREGHAAFLAAQGRTLAQDIASTKSQIIAQRVAMIQEAINRNATTAPPALPPFPGTSSQPGPFAGFASAPVPADLAQKWGSAQQEVVLVETLLQGHQFTPEDAASASAIFVDFYLTLLPLAESRDRADRELEQFEASLAESLRRPPPPCPSCHAPVPPSEPRRFKAPAPRGPVLRAAVDQALTAKSDAAWPDILESFGRATTAMDALLLAMLPENSTARQGFAYSQELLKGQLKVQSDYPNAVKIPAVFYPKDKWVTTDGEKGEKIEIASGIPWYFYLTNTGGDYRTGYSWTLQDTTSPGRPEASYHLDAYESFTRSYGHVQANDPPPKLFQKLNDKLVFPEGMLYWTHPNGKPGAIETTASWSLSDWLTAIGIGLAGLAIILGTAGLATPAVLAGLGVLGAAAGIASTLSDLKHRSELGILTEEEKSQAVLFIAADLASIFALGLGHAAAEATRLASAAGRATRLTFLVQRVASVAATADKMLGSAVMISVALDFVDQYQAIQNSNLPEAEREAALKRLALTGLLTGAMIVTPHALSRGPHEAPSGVRPGEPDPSGRITVTRPSGEPSAGWSRPKQETQFVEWSRKQDVLPPEHASHELQIAEKEGVHRPLADDPQFSRDIELNEHHWKLKRDGTGWCRLTKKACYSNAQLLVGARGKAERVSAMATLEEVARFRRKELARQPSDVRTDQARLDWIDYSFYAERRLQMIEKNIAAGKAPPEPPRTFESFRSAYPPGHIIRENIQASRFEKRTAEEFAEVFKEAGTPERAGVVLEQHHISESATPGRMKGELTRPDFLVPLPSGKVIAVSNKSRNSFLNKKESQIRAQVRRDLEELVEKNSQERYIRRHKDVGPVEINELWLLYDAAMVPSQHKATIRDEVAKFRRVYRETGLTFGVQIL